MCSRFQFQTAQTLDSDFKFTYETVDDLFNFITGNNSKQAKSKKSKLPSNINYSENKKTCKKGKNSSVNLKNPAYTSPLPSYPSDKKKTYLASSININAFDYEIKRKIIFEEKSSKLNFDVESIKNDIIKKSVFNNINNIKIMPIFTDEWIQAITKLCNTKI